MTSQTFTRLHLVFTAISLLTYIVDIITDLVVTAEHYVHRDYVWGSLMLVFILLPCVVTQIFSMRWYLVDNTATWTDWLFHVLLLAPIKRYFTVLRIGFTSRKTSGLVEELLIANNDVCLLRLFEAFLESGPQLLLQAYILLTQRSITWVTGLSVVASLVSMCWSLAAYSDAQRLLYRQNQQRRWGSYIMQTLWHVGMITSRVAAIVVFSVIFKAWVVLFLGLHWILMTVCAFLQRTDFGSTWWEERLFNGVAGFIHIFCFMNIQDGRTRWLMLSYYTIYIVENSLLVVIWYLYQTERMMYQAITFSTVFGGFVFGMTCLLMYYRCCHPSLFQVKHESRFNGHQPTTPKQNFGKKRPIFNLSASSQVQLTDGNMVDLSLENAGVTQTTSPHGSSTFYSINEQMESYINDNADQVKHTKEPKSLKKQQRRSSSQHNPQDEHIIQWLKSTDKLDPGIASWNLPFGGDPRYAIPSECCSLPYDIDDVYGRVRGRRQPHLHVQSYPGTPQSTQLSVYKPTKHKRYDSSATTCCDDKSASVVSGLSRYNPTTLSSFDVREMIDQSIDRLNDTEKVREGSFIDVQMSTLLSPYQSVDHIKVQTNEVLENSWTSSHSASGIQKHRTSASEVTTSSDSSNRLRKPRNLSPLDATKLLEESMNRINMETPYHSRTLPLSSKDIPWRTTNVDYLPATLDRRSHSPCYGSDYLSLQRVSKVIFNKQHHGAQCDTCGSKVPMKHPRIMDMSPLKVSCLDCSPQRLGRNVDLFDREAWRKFINKGSSSITLSTDEQCTVQSKSVNEILSEHVSKSKLSHSMLIEDLMDTPNYFSKQPPIKRKKEKLADTAVLDSKIHHSNRRLTMTGDVTKESLPQSRASNKGVESPLFEDSAFAFSSNEDSRSDREIEYYNLLQYSGQSSATSGTSSYHAVSDNGTLSTTRASPHRDPADIGISSLSCLEQSPQLMYTPWQDYLQHLENKDARTGREGTYSYPKDARTGGDGTYSYPTSVDDTVKDSLSNTSDYISYKQSSSDRESSLSEPQEDVSPSQAKYSNRKFYRLAYSETSSVSELSRLSVAKPNPTHSKNAHLDNSYKFAMDDPLHLSDSCNVSLSSFQMYNDTEDMPRRNFPAPTSASVTSTSKMLPSSKDQSSESCFADVSEMSVAPTPKVSINSRHGNSKPFLFNTPGVSPIVTSAPNSNKYGKRKIKDEMPVCGQTSRDPRPVGNHHKHYASTPLYVQNGCKNQIAEAEENRAQLSDTLNKNRNSTTHNFSSASIADMFNSLSKSHNKYSSQSQEEFRNLTSPYGLSKHRRQNFASCDNLLDTRQNRQKSLTSSVQDLSMKSSRGQCSNGDDSRQKHSQTWNYEDKENSCESPVGKIIHDRNEKRLSRQPLAQWN